MSQIQPAVPDRRLAPRPLPAHLLSAIVLWLSSRAALMSWRGGSPLSNAPAENPLQALAKEFEKLGVDRVAAALDRELLRRAQDFAAGLQAYRRHPFRRAAPRTPVAWQEGNVRLLDYGSARKAPAVLVVPSLINRYYVLDLLPEQSFLRHLAASGLRPFVVDWGEPGAAERDFTLSDYIAGPLDRVLTKARDLTRGPVTIIGYCMGGLLALALALRRPSDTAALALLATPWDFHAERLEQAQDVLAARHGPDHVLASLRADAGPGGGGDQHPVDAGTAEGRGQTALTDGDEPSRSGTPSQAGATISSPVSSPASVWATSR